MSINFNNLKIFSCPKKAFTVAEVLIAIAIIGVVAILVVPLMVNSYDESMQIVKLKKFERTMDNAVRNAVAVNGEVYLWGLTNSLSENSDGSNKEEVAESRLNGPDKFLDMISDELVFKERNTYAEALNQANRPQRFSLDGTENGRWGGALMTLKDGAMIRGIWITNESCSHEVGESEELKQICGEIFYDTNGNRPPNATGKDVFLFYITSKGVIPMGTAGQTASFTFEDYCDIDKSNTLNGYGCTAWVIQNENKDYLKCPDSLSWDGKHSCHR